MTPSEKANRARDLMADPVMEAAFSDIRMGMLANLESVPISDIDTQHEITLMLQLLRRVRDQLNRYGQDELIESHRAKNESFIQRIRQSIRA